MSTRSVIAQDAGDGFEGIYHHWDGYPSGLGKTLWDLYQQQTLGTCAEDLRDVLIHEHPGYWSTINGADWGLPAGRRDRNLEPCGECGQANWRHYGQYYGGSTRYTDEPPPMPGQIQQLGHSFVIQKHSVGPECSCHDKGRPTGDTQERVKSWGDDHGTEWAYVLRDYELTIFERRWTDGGEHMTGMFEIGGGTDRAQWAWVGAFPWDGPEPDWAKLEGSDEDE